MKCTLLRFVFFNSAVKGNEILSIAKDPDELVKCLRKESFKDSANKNPVPAVLECYMCEKNREVPMLYKAALVLRGVPEKTGKRQILSSIVISRLPLTAS